MAHKPLDSAPIFMSRTEGWVYTNIKKLEEEKNVPERGDLGRTLYSMT